MKVLRFPLLFFTLAVLASGGFAWYNDTASNDAGLLIESTYETYGITKDNPTVTGQIKITNPGLPFTGTISVFFEKQHAGKITLKPFEINKTLLEKSTKSLSYLGNFEPKIQKKIELPAGETLLDFEFEIDMQTPEDEQGEFVFIIENEANPEQKSILDPYWDTGEYLGSDPYAIALYHCNETEGTDVFDATGNFDATATNALIWDASGKWNGACGMDGTYWFTQDTLMDLNYERWTIEFWWKPLENYSAGLIDPDWYFLDKKTVGTNGISMSTRKGQGDIAFHYKGIDSVDKQLTTTTAVWTSGTWYHFSIEYDGTNLNLYVDGIKEDTIVATAGLEEGTASNFYVGNSTGEGFQNNGVFDEIALFNIDMNSVVTDANFLITAIDGYDIDDALPAFSYLVDKNVSIDFNVFVKSNARVDVDINYSTVNTQGTGTPIFLDLNLTSDICADQDWNDVPSHCSIDWNIMSVTDNNYYIVIDSNIFYFGSTISPKSFMVANDVNLNIKVPIDEVTNEAIDTSVTSFIVKILQGETLSTYSGQVDQNYFMIPFGTGEIIVVQIDTNRTDLYYGRIYSYLFETTQPKLVLQPYLAPISDSILTTIHTLSAVNLNPLSGLRMKIFKDLVGGRTLIHDSSTDGKGETAIPFVIADEYEIEVYQESVLLTTKDYTATSTTNNLYFYISDEGEIVIPDFANVTVNFLPALRTHSTRDVNVSVVIASNTLSVSAIQVVAVNNDVNIYDSGMDTSAPSDGNTYIINFDYILAMDGNYPVEFVVIVVLENGEEFYFNDDSYWFGRGENNLITLLSVGMRTDFGCNSTNLSVTCEPLLFIALFIILFTIAGIGLTTYKNGIGLTILLLILAGAFVYIAWVPLWIYVLMFIAGIGAMVSMSRMD